MTTTNKEASHVSDCEDLPAADLCGDHIGDPLESLESSGGGADFSLFDPGVFGNLEDDFSLDLLDDEESSDSPYNRFEKLSHSSQSDLPKPRRRRRAEAISRITSEDFAEGPERDSFELIDRFSAQLFSNKSKPQEIAAAISFFFTITDDGEHHTFPLCCAVLNARIDVLRLRLVYEWWLRGTIFTGPFPFFTVPVPSIIAGEITYYGSDVGYALSRECWVQPGIEADELVALIVELDDHEESEVRNALQVLESHLLMSNQAGRCYVTGRNPMLLTLRAEQLHGGSFARGDTFHWSRLFGKSS